MEDMMPFDVMVLLLLPLIAFLYLFIHSID